MGRRGRDVQALTVSSPKAMMKVNGLVRPREVKISLAGEQGVCGRGGGRVWSGLRWGGGLETS